MDLRPGCAHELQAPSRSLLKKSLFKNDFLRKWDTAAEKWPFLYAGSQNIAFFGIKWDASAEQFFE